MAGIGHTLFGRGVTAPYVRTNELLQRMQALRLPADLVYFVRFDLIVLVNVR